MITPDELRDYARIDAPGEDDLITSLLAAAESAVRESTGKRRPETSGEGAVYDLAIKMLAAHWYDIRTPVDSAPVREIPYTVTMLMNHISLCDKYPLLGV